MSTSMSLCLLWTVCPPGWGTLSLAFLSLCGCTLPSTALLSIDFSILVLFLRLGSRCRFCSPLFLQLWQWSPSTLSLASSHYFRSPLSVSCRASWSWVWRVRTIWSVCWWFQWILCRCCCCRTLWGIELDCWLTLSYFCKDLQTILTIRFLCCFLDPHCCIWAGWLSSH